MTEKVRGLILPDGRLRTDQEIRRDLAIRGQLPRIDRGTPLAIGKSFEERAEILRRRSQEAREMSPAPSNHVKVNLPRTSIVSFIGDQHIGHPECDIDRVQQEVEVIANSPDSYVVFLGDSVDGICWGGESQSEQVSSLDEQHGFIRSMFRKLRGKIIAGFSGEHDSKWSARSGPDAMGRFQEDADAPYIKGVGEVEIGVGDQTYRLVASHSLRGHSIYNNTHPQMRSSRELQGADIYASGHNHTKGVAQQPVREFGQARVVTHIATGTYKKGDSWSRRDGYTLQKTEQMGGAAVRLHDDHREVEICDDIVTAHRRWSGFTQVPELPRPVAGKKKEPPNNGVKNERVLAKPRKKRMVQVE